MSVNDVRRQVAHEVYGIAFREAAAYKDTYGGVGGIVFLESHHIVPADVASDTVLLFMHPIGGGAFLPFVQAMARAGVHVIYCNSRYRGNDSALIMEKVLIDMGEAIADAKRRFGYERVVLAGWSGGGPLSLFYQQQARRPTITTTPAGDDLDLTERELQAADAMLLIADPPEPPPRPRRLPRSGDRRRGPSRRSRPGVRPVRRRRPAAAILSEFRRGLPRTPAGPQPAYHGLGQGPAAGAARGRRAARRARLRRPRHDGRSALARSRARPQ